MLRCLECRLLALMALSMSCSCCVNVAASRTGWLTCQSGCFDVAVQLCAVRLMDDAAHLLYTWFCWCDTCLGTHKGDSLTLHTQLHMPLGSAVQCVLQVAVAWIF